MLKQIQSRAKSSPRPCPGPIIVVVPGGKIMPAGRHNSGDGGARARKYIRAPCAAHLWRAANFSRRPFNSPARAARENRLFREMSPGALDRLGAAAARGPVHKKCPRAPVRERPRITMRALRSSSLFRPAGAAAKSYESSGGTGRL